MMTMMMEVVVAVAVLLACEVFKIKFPLIEILMSGNNQNSN